MGTYTIGEVAERTGFTASALRYYEGRGLLQPLTRTESGYRVYDDRALGRLGFIARAKRLGCSLEEIVDLAALWDAEECTPVQRRFHELVTVKIAAAEAQVAELTAFATQLRAAAGQLAGPAIDGPCTDSCACSTTSTGVAQPTEVPIACTLDATAVPDRLAQWQAVVERAATRERTIDDAVRLTFDADVVLEDLARLVAAEQACCTFLGFTITVDQHGVGLEVRAPAGTGDIVTSLLGDVA